ncbi:MAG: CDP-alcohol phosphatidyltransferase family protein [Humidesulfovibrio sp.]|jgi:cardiolipin synthase|uniref:CDP-alcohol phosphatidyltransferase family protein n=1 Tax=Humidesulfovibrio sp. TaxID=2910988 RepID=UPI002734E721|nr:CDP-alcohol phosphatidyltransferase family protein [Humidesulfovibrio sp.]MDP2848075.1 CDP-alcohol phosphatidyltransferase family protein [Humidesulfovibrio sp.]
MTPPLRENNWTIPNMLTVTRIMLTPGFVMAFVDRRFDIAWVLFAVAGFTDALDGALARILKQRSSFGAMLDPLADKILLVTSFICLGVQDWIPGWLTVLVVSRDMFIVGGLALLHYSGVDVKRGIRPVWISKCATTAQISLVLLIMVEHSMESFHPDIRLWLVYTVAALTALSGVYYLVIGLRMFPHNDNGHSRP